MFYNPADHTAGPTLELLLGRYVLEPLQYPDSFLAQHKKVLFLELHTSLATVLSHCSWHTIGRSSCICSLIQAIGHCIVYNAACPL